MDIYSHANRFEDIIKRMLEFKGYDIDHKFPESPGYDFNFLLNNDSIFVECKFYKSTNVSTSILLQSIELLAKYLSDKKQSFGVLITNCIVPVKVRDEAKKKYGIQVLDNSYIMGELVSVSFDLKNEYERLLLDSQQLPEKSIVYTDEITIDPISLSGFIPSHWNFMVPKPSTRGAELTDELKNIPCGKKGWSDFEAKCLDIFKFLFEDDLSLWEPQNRTDDGLSRFDLICRVASIDDFWKSLISAFNSRFVLFEFKNYCDPIDQNQIYTTERYLYVKALRSVGFIIARNGVNTSAVSAAKGALKEHGKLILILTQDDLLEMLKLKDNGDNPNDYLAEKLDRWLIGLSR